MHDSDSNNDFERLLSPEEVARACGLSRRAVYRAIARGELRAARLCHWLRVPPAQALRWSDVRERTLLIEKAADGQGGVKPTKTGQARTVRLLAPLARDLASGAAAVARSSR